MRRDSKMQEVQVYYDILNAANDMEEYISSGWRVHTCSISTHTAGYTISERVLVIYEK